MKDQVAKMRRDYEALANARVAAGLWGREDAQEISCEIKAALDAKDAERVRLWADWLAEQAAIAAGALDSGAKAAAAKGGCRSCGALVRPGLVAVYPDEHVGPRGYCSGRADLPPAYGDGHPLRQLPADMGAICSAWVAA